jgi:hypothetical protein
MSEKRPRRVPRSGFFEPHHIVNARLAENQHLADLSAA